MMSTEQDAYQRFRTLVNRLKVIFGNDNVQIRLHEKDGKYKVLVLIDRPKCTNIAGLCTHYPPAFDPFCKCPCCEQIANTIDLIHELAYDHMISIRVNSTVLFKEPGVEPLGDVKYNPVIDEIDYTDIIAKVIDWTIKFEQTDMFDDAPLYRQLSRMIRRLLETVYGKKNVQVTLRYGIYYIKIFRELPERGGLGDYEYLRLCTQIANEIIYTCYEMLKRARFDSIIEVPGSTRRKRLLAVSTRIWVIWQNEVSKSNGN